MVRDEQGYLTATHVIRTPELVEFQFELAGLCSRMLAWGVDGLLSAAVTALLLLALSLLSVLSAGLAGFLSFVAVFLVQWAYFAGFEWRMAGQTPGKKMLGLRVMQRSGVRIDFVHAALRNLLRPLDHLPLLYAVGGGAALFSDARQRLGDRVAGTVVVRERRRRTPSGVLTAVGEQVARTGASEDRLRRATVAERDLLFLAALRREELELGARLRLFGELAEHLEARFGVARPAHLSDEKVVLDAMATLLRLEGAGASKAAPARPLRSA